MNVLLAEADVCHDRLTDTGQVNPTFAQTDVAMVIGAKDVVNPVAPTRRVPSQACRPWTWTTPRRRL